MRRAAEACLASTASRVVVVVGAAADAVRAELADLSLRCVENPDWASGLASSIRTGLGAVGEADAVLLVLADQPALGPAQLDALVAAARGPHAIAASAYAGRLGAPACLGRDHFAALAALGGDEGARTLLARPGVAAIPFPGGELDVDTEEDLRRAMGSG